MRIYLYESLPVSLTLTRHTSPLAIQLLQWPAGILITLELTTLPTLEYNYVSHVTLSHVTLSHCHTVIRHTSVCLYLISRLVYPVSLSHPPACPGHHPTYFRTERRPSQQPLVLITRGNVTLRINFWRCDPKHLTHSNLYENVLKLCTDTDRPEKQAV